MKAQPSTAHMFIMNPLSGKSMMNLFSTHPPMEKRIEKLTGHAAPKLRYPTTDVSTGKPLRYSMLHDGVELPRDQTVGTSFPKRRGRVHVVHEYANAHLKLVREGGRCQRRRPPNRSGSGG